MANPVDQDQVDAGGDYTLERVLDAAGGLAGDDGVSGERKLLLGILEMAISDLTNRTPRNDDARAHARRWILADSKGARYPSVQTFEGICDELGLDAVRLRQRVIAMAARSGRRRKMSHNGEIEDLQRLEARRPRIVPMIRRTA